MCKVELINENAITKVTYCKSCKDVQLNFGLVIYILDQIEFINFKNYLNHLHKKHYSKGIITEEKIYISTRNQKTILAFNIYELTELCNLLNETSILLDVKNILSA